MYEHAMRYSEGSANLELNFQDKYSVLGNYKYNNNNNLGDRFPEIKSSTTVRGGDKKNQCNIGVEFISCKL
jgi:hypothetical protein